jgi:hypothetical protein
MLGANGADANGGGDVAKRNWIIPTCKFRVDFPSPDSYNEFTKSQRVGKGGTMIEYLPVLVSILLLLVTIPTYATLADARGRRSATIFGLISLSVGLIVLVVVAVLARKGFRSLLLEWSLPFLLFVLFVSSGLGTPGLRRKDTRRRRL